MPRAAATNRFRIRDFVSSLLFDGTTSTVAVPHNANQLLTSGFTISAWINPRTRGETAGRIVDKSEATNGTNGFIFSVDSIAANRMLCQINAGSSVSSAGNSIKLGIWQHVLITVSSAALVTHYINSSASGSPATTGALSGIITTNALTIGNRSGATDRTFDGWIDEVRIWNRVLTAQEISDLYLLGTASTTGLISEYLFNEGAGTVATDTSASANNGTITAATYSTDVPMKARKQVDGNRVKNGDFEYAPPFTAAGTGAGRWIDGTSAGSTTNDLFGWAFLTETGTGSVQFDSSTKNSGSYSIKVSTLATGSLARVSNVLTTGGPDVVNRAIPVTPNTDYDLVYYLKTNYVSGDSNDGAYILLSYADAAGAGISSVSSTKIKTTTDWTRYSVRFTTPATCRFIYPRPGVVGDTGTATLIMDSWFDDISITPVYPEGRVPANGNLVKNFDFEVAPTFVAATTTQGRFVDGTASGAITNATYKWKGQSGAGATAVQFDPTVSHSGTYSMKLSALDVTGSFYVDVGAGIASSEPVATLQLYAIPIIGLTSYTLTGWVKTNNVPTNGAFLQLATYGVDGTRINNVGSSVKLTGTNDWTQITITTTVGSAAVWATVGLMKNVAGNISDAWFDDIYLAPTTNPGRVPIT